MSMTDPSNAPGPYAVFSRDLQRAIAECREADEQLALLVVQVDQLERVEGALGYSASAALADQFCTRVGQMLRERDRLHHVGDRKFWVILRATRNEGHAVLAANKLRRVGREPFRIGEHTLKLETSIGIALFPQHAENAEELVRRADLALVNAREDDLPIRVYAEDSTRRIAGLWEVENELERALEESEFELFYQPKIDLRTFRPCGAEALLRWRNPVRGLLGPDSFLPIAEGARKLEPITWFVLDAAQRQRCEWPKLWGELPVSVNIAPSVLDAGHLIDYIRGSMRIWGSQTSHIMLEVTEDSVVRNPKQSFAALAQLRQKGIRVSIDDFGTGYSSMTYFKEMPADELKIDKSFIQNLHRDEGNRHIVRTIIDLAHTFHYAVVAEGVERADVLEMLIEMGCDIAQGYLYARPMPHAEFVQWLSDYRVPVAHRREAIPAAGA
jgi:diguanylate cyclase (GGDEF)-like protein